MAIHGMILLERAAQALYERDHDGRFPLIPPGEPIPWSDLMPDSKSPYLEEARAVLAAIREPSEAVLTAMRDTVPVDGYEWDYVDSAAIPHWQTMIDALLEEGK